MSKDGGPAFPGFQYVDGYGSERKNSADQWEHHEPGMTLRDYLAAKAMGALLVNLTIEHAATEAYKVADAMLHAREGE